MKNNTYYRVYRYAKGGMFVLATKKKFENFGDAWGYYYNGGKHLGKGLYMIVKSQAGKNDEVISILNVKQ